MVANGKTLQAALAVPHRLPRLTDLGEEKTKQKKQIKKYPRLQNQAGRNELKFISDIYTVHNLFTVTTLTGVNEASRLIRPQPLSRSTYMALTTTSYIYLN